MLKFFCDVARNLLFILALVFSIDVSHSQNVGESSEITDEKIEQVCSEMDKLIPETMQKLGIPGAAYVVARKNKIAHVATFGLTAIDKEKAEPVSPETLFPLSSLSKNVTATLVGALVDAGKIKLDDKVRKYLPCFFLGTEELSAEITIKDLISHRSGFKHFASESLFVANYDNDTILNALKILKPKPEKFRKSYGYQNVIYGLVGFVLEAATGEKYEDLVKKYIFDKMKMENSSVIPLMCEESFWQFTKYKFAELRDNINSRGFFAAIKIFASELLNHKSKRVVTTHSRYNGVIYELEKSYFYQKFAATAGVSFSAIDMAKFLIMIANKGTFEGRQIVSKEVFEELETEKVEISRMKDTDHTFPIERIERKDAHYCSGIFRAHYSDKGTNAHQIFFHTAGIAGASAFLCYSRPDDIYVSVICNFGGSAHSSFSEYTCFDILDRCFGFVKFDWAQKDLDNRAYVEHKKSQIKNHLSRNIAPMDSIDKYVGTYSNDIYKEIKIFKKGDKLMLSNGIRTIQLKHLNRDIFEFPEKDLIYAYCDTDDYAIFIKDDIGNITSLDLLCFHENNSRFEKVE
ncbi:hypothetical protein FACS1894113_2910 [Alphaproteobacteria bacterium]|nr:hypothetical protein FACS1894113_2910 [Alphaproteobacteria bacterium]